MNLLLPHHHPQKKRRLLARLFSPSSVIRNLSSVIRNPSSVIRPRSSVIRHPSSKKSRHALLLGICVLIILLPLAIFLARTPQVSKGWYDDNWAYRTKYTLTNNGSAVTDRQVTLTIDTQSLISEGKLLSDCSDSGFVTQSGVVLSYYLDSGSGACNTEATVYKVIIPTIHSGTTVIYHYYGNPSARSTASLTAFSQDPFTPDTLSAASEETSPAPIAHYRLDEGYNLKQDSQLEQQIEIVNQEYQAGWYDFAWTRRQPITLTNSTASELTNYQLLLTIPYDTDMQPDFDDLRFTSATDSALLLPYWLESKTDESTASVHIKVDSIAASPFPTTIYMYYGNPTADSASHPNSTLEFYETFDGTTINDSKFTYGGGTFNQNEYVSIVNNANAWDQYFFTTSTITREATKSFQARFKADVSTNAMIGWHDPGTGASYSDLVYAIYFNNGTLRIYEDNNNRASVGSYTRGDWYDIKIELKATGAYYYLKATTDEEWALLYDSNYSSESPLRPGIAHNTATYYSLTDDWLVTKTSESLTTSFGTKETTANYHPQDNSLGIILYDPSYYNGATPYLEALVSTDSATWALSRSSAFTNPDGPKEYTVRVRPGDNNSQLPTVQLYNLTDDTEATSLTFGNPQDTTAHLKAARLVVIQSHPASITNTHSHQEIGAAQTTTTGSYTALTDKKYHHYETSAYSPSPNTYFDTSIDVTIPDNKIEQQINILNKEYFSSKYDAFAPTDNSLGLIQWDGSKYPGAKVYFEAVLKGVSRTNSAALYDSSGNQVPGSVVVTTGTLGSPYARIRSNDISAALTNGYSYTAQMKSTQDGTGYIQSARLIIIQSDETKITDTETAIEVGNTEKQASASATPLTHPKIYQYDASKYSPTPEAYFEASLRSSQPTIEQQTNITSRNYTTTSTSDSPTDNSLGIFKWDASKYSGSNIQFYLEANIRTLNTGATARYTYATLYNTSTGNAVSGSTASASSSSGSTAWQYARSDAFSNLVDGETYTVRIRVSNSSYTANIQSARLIIIQSDETKITGTQTVVEVGDYQTGITATSATPLTNPKIYKYDASVFSPSIESSGDASFSATLKIDDSSDTAYAELHNCGSPCNPASSQLVAQVSHTGDTNWTYVEATNIDADSDWDTSNTDEYIVKVYCADGGADGCSANIANAKILLNQSDGAGITALETYQQQVNTAKTGATATPTSQGYYNWYNPDLETSMRSFAGGTLNYHYEATMKTSAGTGYARLYNSTDASAISGSVIETTSSDYELVRTSTDITASLPQYPQSTGKNLDTQIYNAATNTTSVSNSWVVVQVSDLSTTGVTAYADLYNLTDGLAVTSSEVSTPSASWALVRSPAITLTTGKDYVVRLRSSHGGVPVHMQNAKILLSQSYVNGITALETYQQQVNTLKTGATTTPTSQGFPTYYNPDLVTDMRSFAGGTLNYHYEATIKTTAGTGYARLYNSTDASAISGSVIETTSSDYELVRTQEDFTTALPQHPQITGKNLDTQIYNSATDTTSVSNSWIVVQVSDLATTGVTAYADLYNLDEEAVVSGSEVSTTSPNWDLVRTASPITLSSGDRYVVRTWSTNGAWIHLQNAKILLDQSSEAGITALETYQQQVNTTKTGATTTPTSQSYFTWYNPDLETDMRSFASAGSIVYHYEATMKTSAGTGYARLYNSTDASAISGSVIETTSSDYELVRTQTDITATLPQYPQSSGKNLDTQIYNSATNTTSVSNSWVVVQVSDLSTTGVTAYADLYNLDEEAVVSGSEVSTTSPDWVLERTASPITLSSGDRYVVRLRSSHGGAPIHLQNAKILLSQSSEAGITALETYQQQVNTAKTQSTSTYTAQTYYNSFDWSNFTGELSAFYEATIKTSGGTGFARLASPTSSEITTTSADYELVRSSDLIDAMPLTATNLDTQIKNSATDTTSVSNSWVAIQVSDLGNPPAYAALYESGASCTNQVSGSEVKVNLSDGWKRVRTVSPITLTDATDYMVCVKAAPGTTASIANAKVVHAQSAPEGIAKVATYQSLVSIPSTDTDDQYTTQSALSSYNPSNFTGDKVVYHEASLKTSGGTGYVRLIDSDSSDAITGSELTTTQTGYTRVRSDDIGSALGTGGTLDVEVKNSAANTTSLSSSVLVINTTFTSFSIIHDSASGSLHGTMADGTWVTPSGCISGTCLEFDGLNDHIYVNDHSRLDFGASDSFSLSFWFKHPAKRHDQKEVILSKFESSGGDGGYQVYLNGNGTLTVGITDDGSVFPKDAATSSAALTDNAWHHVVAVKDETSLSLYLDGALTASTNSLNTTGSLANNDKLFIAIDNDEESYPYLGLLDEIKIYRYARPPQGIRSDFVKSGGSKGVSAAFGIQDDTYLTASQIGHWPLDETEAGSCTGGKDACDATQNLLHGTWQSGATPTYGQYGSGLELSGGDDGLIIDADTGWYDPSWTNRLQLTFDNSASTEDLTDFPVLVKLNSSRIDYTKTQDQGQDLRFTASDSATLLPHEIETWNESGDSFVWVKVPTIPAGSTTDYIYLYYNHPTIEDGQDAENVWNSNYVLVHHLNETSGTSTYDSTSNNNDGSKLGATDPNPSSSGKINGAQDFDGSNDYISVTPSGSTLNVSNYTVSAWVKMGSLGGQENNIVSKNFSTQSNVPFYLVYTGRQVFGDSRNGFGIGTYSGSWIGVATGQTPTLDTFYYVTGTFDGSTFKIYVDGSLIQSRNYTLTVPTNTSNIGIGMYNSTYPMRFDGIIDEVRISNNIRSADWIKAEHLTTTDAFNTYNTPEPYTPPILNSLTSGFTVSGWFNPSTLGAVERVLVSRGDAGSEDWYVKLSATESGKLLFSSDGVNEGTSSLTLPLDTWSHVVMAADEGIGKLFVNGVQVGQVVHQGTTAGGDLAFGTYPSGGSGFSGVMDELRLYAATLSSGQVASLYRHAPGPRGYWDFNEGVRDAVYDKSGHNLTGLWQGNGKHWDTGKYGKGGSFDGSSDYVQVQGSASGIRSLSFWAKPSSLTTSLLTLGSTVSASLSAGTLQTQGLTNVAIKVNGKAGTTLSANTWSHVSLTFDPFNAASILFGKVGSSYYHGLLDDIKLFDYHLTQAQVVSHLNASHPAPGSPIGSAYLHYLLDEGYGEVANNSGHGGSGVNGTLSNGTWTNEGKLGKGLVFTASTSLTTTIADPGYEHSLSLWLKPSTSIASKTLVTTDKLTTDASSRPVYGGCTGTAIPLDEWTHLLAVSDGASSCAIYQNGVKTATGTTGVTFGTTLNLGSSSYTGIIDEFKFYNLALTANQAKVEYNQGQSTVFGAGRDSEGNVSFAASSDYCVPGDSSTCSPPIAHWSLDEKGAISMNDSSGNNLIGTLNNSPLWTRGKHGSGISFNHSSQFISVPDNSLLRPGNGSWTVSLWINLPNISQIGSILAKSQNGSTYKEFHVFVAESINMTDPGKQIGFSFRENDNNERRLISTNTVADGKWHHYSFVADKAANAVRIYQDGKPLVLTGENDGVWPTIDNTDSLVIGRHYADSSTHAFTGSVDNILIFNYPRTPAQIAWDYNQGAPLAYYKFDQCSGDTAYDTAPKSDKSVAGYHGTIYPGDSSGNNDTVGSCNDGLENPTNSMRGAGTTGKRNASLSFDGTNDYVDAGDIDTLDSLTAMTVCSWVKHNTSNSDDFIVAKWNDVGGFMILRDDVGSVSGRTDMYKVHLSNDYYIEGSTNSAPISQWNYVCFSYQADTSNGLRLYINGIEDRQSPVSTAGSGILNAGTSSLLIGKRSGTGDSGFFDGLIDDVKIFNYVLTPELIKIHMNEGAVSFRD